jgi:hypothetical protein
MPKGYPKNLFFLFLSNSFDDIKKILSIGVKKIAIILHIILFHYLVKDYIAI